MIVFQLRIMGKFEWVVKPIFGYKVVKVKLLASLGFGNWLYPRFGSGND